MIRGRPQTRRTKVHYYVEGLSDPKNRSFLSVSGPFGQRGSRGKTGPQTPEGRVGFTPDTDGDRRLLVGITYFFGRRRCHQEPHPGRGAPRGTRG